MLWAACMEKGYSAPIWMTFRQAHELGGHVRKGEKGALVVCANTITRKAMKQDKRAIFTAAAHAQRAADFLHGKQDAAQDAAAA